MSLATRCPTCATTFRVAQDQLKASEGWVRCGRCDHVFNALEGLFDLERDAATGVDLPLAAATVDPAEREASSRAGSRGTPEDPGDGDERDAGMSSGLGELLTDPIDAHLFGPRKRTESPPKPAGPLASRDHGEFTDARFDSDLFADNASQPEADLLGATDAGALPLESSGRPEFVRRAERRARWQGASSFKAVTIAAALLAIVLCVQLGHHFRDDAAARWPAAKPALAAWCRIAGCMLAPLQRIDEIVVESTALTRAATPDAFVLSVNLRSRSAVPLALPSVDLALTDTSGRLIARRALAAREFRAADVLAPRAEAALQLVLATSPTVVGYTVEIFYP